MINTSYNSFPFDLLLLPTFVGTKISSKVKINFICASPISEEEHIYVHNGISTKQKMQFYIYEILVSSHAFVFSSLLFYANKNPLHFLHQKILNSQ